MYSINPLYHFSSVFETDLPYQPDQCNLHLSQKYLLPALQPPSESELTAAQEALTAKYDEAAAILASLQEETSEIKQSLGDQCTKVDEAVGQVGDTLESLKEREKERDEEIKNMRDEVDTLKSLIERVSKWCQPLHATRRLVAIIDTTGCTC